jgi:hypothetical protein
MRAEGNVIRLSAANCNEEFITALKERLQNIRDDMLGLSLALEGAKMRDTIPGSTAAALESLVLNVSLGLEELSSDLSSNDPQL